jgi:hypothetical protein
VRHTLNTSSAWHPFLSKVHHGRFSSSYYMYNPTPQVTNPYDKLPIVRKIVIIHWTAQDINIVYLSSMAIGMTAASIESHYFCEMYHDRVASVSSSSLRYACGQVEHLV